MIELDRATEPESAFRPGLITHLDINAEEGVDTVERDEGTRVRVRQLRQLSDRFIHLAQ